MRIKILTVGKRNENWIETGVQRYLERLRPPFSATFEIIPNSTKSAPQAVTEESERVLRQVQTDDYVILLDERGKNLSSIELSDLITSNVQKKLVFIIGGAFGVSEDVKQRANTTWSLSRLVFPHQIVRLILAEQLYRSQEIEKGTGYHHE